LSWQIATTTGNLAVGIAEFVASSASNAMSVAVDGAHNFGDAFSYFLQAKNARDLLQDPGTLLRRRKVAYWLLASTSVAAGMKAGYDMGWGEGHESHISAVYTSGASLAMNGLLLARLKRELKVKSSENYTADEHGLLRHFWQVDMPSASLAFSGAILQRYDINAEHVVAIASSGLGAFFFRPTKKNLNKNCAH